jgi:hypothetical protein
MYLFSTDGREPFQKLVYGCALVQMLEKRDNGQTRTAEAPLSVEFRRISVDSAAEAPVHSISLSMIGWSAMRRF